MSEHLALADIREVWEAILPGLLTVKAKTEAPWRPEDIYAACVSGQAHLYQGDTGFIVVQPDRNKLTGAPELLVWVAYAQGSGNIDRFQAEVDDLAREHGFATLTMQSNRPGWDRAAGWKPVAMLYERRL